MSTRRRASSALAGLLVTILAFGLAAPAIADPGGVTVDNGGSEGTISIDMPESGGDAAPGDASAPQPSPAQPAPAPTAAAQPTADPQPAANPQPAADAQPAAEPTAAQPSAVATTQAPGSTGTTGTANGTINQGTGGAKQWTCDIFYKGPDGRVWTPWYCNPANPLVTNGVKYHGTANLKTLTKAPFVKSMVKKMGIKAPKIASTPDDPQTEGAVGLPVWFWVANPGPETTGPNSITATAGTMTVTATARLTGLSIDTGDGHTVTCDGPGTPYPGTGVQPSPDCGYVYPTTSETQPGGTFTVKTRAHWRIQWTDNQGHVTTMNLDLVSQKQLKIGQLEAVKSGS